MRPTLPCQLRLRKTVWRIDSSKPSPRTTATPEQTPLRAAYYRGGTSRALLLQPQDLPASHAKWRGIFRQLLGSVGLGEAYGRQLHRLVKETADLGKICLVEPYHKTKEDHDEGKDGAWSPHIDYTFVSVDAKYGHLDVEANCGNMLSAVGPYAYNAHLLPPEIYAIKDGDITITIRNTNTMRLVNSTFAVMGGQAAVTGSHVVDGVNGRGSKISLTFRDPLKSITGKTFPTGKYVDMVEGFRVTCVDGAVPVVFVRADAIGIPGTILPHELKDQKDKLDLLENIRRAAAVEMGISDSQKTVPRTVPKIAVVSQSTQHTTVSGASLKSSQADILVRFISDTEPHTAIPLTGALTTAVAARMPGTIVEQLLAPEEVMPGTVTIAHPSGRIHVKLDYDAEKEPPMWVASVSTTAQRLSEGKAFWTESSQDAKGDPMSKTPRHARGLGFVNELRLRASPADLIERFYKEGHNTTIDFSSTLAGKPNDDSQPPKPDLGLPTSLPTRDTVHLLRELATLRSSLTHFTTLYPAPKSPNAKPETPTPSTISHHLSSIASHINILTSTLKHMPRPPRTITPDRRKGEQWRHWAKTFSRWDKIRLLREAEKKMSRRQTKKAEWERWRDSELNALNARGRPVVMGKWRRRLLQSRGREEEGVEKSAVWKDAHKERDGSAHGKEDAGVGGGSGGSVLEGPDEVSAEGTLEASAGESEDLPGLSSKDNIDVQEKEQVEGTQDCTSSPQQSPHAPQQHPRTFRWPSFKDRANQKKENEQ